MRQAALIVIAGLAGLCGCAEPEVLQQPPEQATMPPPVGNTVPLPAVAEPLPAKRPVDWEGGKQ
ncbi:MAG TPA: hypothetical protein VG651_25490 [Stellaceae bacterium]|nr:hypothetical protein [Stellaceae bacterium]